MINGTHAIIYAQDAARVRGFFRDVLGFPTADAGHGWLLFALPPAELGIHPAEDQPRHEFYLMCDNLERTMSQLAAKGVEFGEVHDAPWGAVSSIKVPGGGEIGLYEPRHPTAIKPATERPAQANRSKASTRTKRAAKPRQSTRKRKR